MFSLKFMQIFLVTYTFFHPFSYILEGEKWNDSENRGAKEFGQLSSLKFAKNIR